MHRWKEKSVASEDPAKCERGGSEDSSQRRWEGTHSSISQIFTEGPFLPVTALGAQDARRSRRINEAQSLSSRS